uniref:Uncharacterized protein n=1 Tax=viral metagenome TaxID=1070528 RepID=A0A6C0BCS6_9ZZZZ
MLFKRSLLRYLIISWFFEILDGQINRNYTITRDLIEEFTKNTPKSNNILSCLDLHF